MLTENDLLVLTALLQEDAYGFSLLKGPLRLAGSSLYHSLAKLTQLGYCKPSVSVTGKGPDRKVYHVSPAGRQALVSALSHQLANLEKERKTALTRYHQLQKRLVRLQSLTRF